MNISQPTREELIKAQENHGIESEVFKMILEDDTKHIVKEREFKRWHSTIYEFSYSALLAMSED